MKVYWLFLIFFIVIYSCKNNKGHAETGVAGTDSIENFFPVTSFIKGEMATIIRDGMNPRFTYRIGNSTDSGWIKAEEFPQAFHPFLTPVIDTQNLVRFFQETKFLDRTLGSFTFTYDPKKILPRDMELRRWDVYLDEETNQVKRIYLVKQIGDTIQQLTWNAGENARLNYFVSFNGRDSLVAEKIITWKY